MDHDASAQQAIHDALAAYCRGMDRCDLALAASGWHVDATAHYLDHPSRPFIEVLESGQALIATKAGVAHRILNVHIVVAGDRAVSEAYGDSVIQEYPADGIVVERQYRGRYIDRWQYRDGRWAICHRRYIADIFAEHRLDIADWPEWALRASKAGREDESYEAYDWLSASQSASGSGVA